MNNEDISKVYFLNVPLENDYKNTLHFDDIDSQHSYFQANIIRSFTDFTYQRKDHIIRVPAHVDTLYDCNYVMYQNPKYSNKWFYAFVKDMKYVNNGTTEIEIETDVMQTWAFNYIVKPSFVEREHVSDDTEGKHTIPEGLEMGEYICNNHIVDENMDSLMKDLRYVVSSTVSESGNNVSGTEYNGIYSGSHYYVYDSHIGVNEFLDTLAQAGKIDGVNGVFLAPRFLTPSGTGGNAEGSVNQTNSPQSYDITIAKNKVLEGYTPKNNKLLCYPYNYLNVSNNSGSVVTYRPELFDGDNCSFIVKGALCPGCSIRMVPKQYKSDVNFQDEGINAGKFPICNFACDMFTNWMTQNAVNIGLSYVESGMQIAMGVGEVAIGNPMGVGTALNGMMSVGRTMAQVHQQSFTPPQVRGNTNCGDVITSAGENNFHFYQMSIKKEYAKCIDGYFNLYGYKVNMVKVPNKCHRSRWWFTKTIGVNIDGDLPQNDLQKIKNVYDNGVTFWRNASEIQDYSLTNEISITDGAVTDE